MLTLLPMGEPQSDAVELRLAVVVTRRGGWAAVGWRDGVEQEAALLAREIADDREALVCFVDVTVQLPSRARFNALLGTGEME